MLIKRLITFRQPRPSALVGEQDPANMLGDVQNRLASMIRVCKDSTVGCMSLLVEVFHRGMNVLFSVFKGQKIYGEL